MTPDRHLGWVVLLLFWDNLFKIIFRKISKSCNTIAAHNVYCSIWRSLFGMENLSTCTVLQVKLVKENLLYCSQPFIAPYCLQGSVDRQMQTRCLNNRVNICNHNTRFKKVFHRQCTVHVHDTMIPCNMWQYSIILNFLIHS